jgi:hypothetical protein
MLCISQFEGQIRFKQNEFDNNFFLYPYYQY